MDFDEWTVNLAENMAQHVSGGILRFEGDPKNPSSVDPSNFPKDLTFLDQARLLRCGMEAIAKSARLNPLRQSSDLKARPTTVEVLEAQAKRFAERPNKPERSVLSRKKTPA